MSCCSSPIEYLIEYVDYLKSQQDPGITMSDLLTVGHIFPNTVNLCCPDYCSDEYMLIGQGTQSLIDYNNFGPGFDFNDCCVNTYFQLNNFLNISQVYLENLPAPPPVTTTLYNEYRACCNNNDTARCVKELLEHTDSIALKEWFYFFNASSTTGLFEYNVINGNFGFCQLVEILKTKPPLIAEEYMLSILELGLVISCKNNGTFVGGLEVYVNTYYPDTGGPA
jgi:hypothetical protein